MSLSFKHIVLVVVALIFGAVVLLANSKPGRVSMSGEFQTSYVALSTERAVYFEDLLVDDLSVSLSGMILTDQDASTGGSFGEIAVMPTTSSDGVVHRGVGATLTGFAVPEDSIVAVELDAANRKTVLRILSGPMEFGVQTKPGSALSVQASLCGNAACDEFNATDRPLFVRTDGEAETIVTFSTPEQSMLLATLVEPSQIDFWKLISTRDVQSKVSGLADGQYSFLETRDRTETINANDILSIVSSGLFIRSLAVSPEAVNLSASGRVRDVRSEIGEKSFSLKPSRFETLQRSPTVQIILGLVSIIFGGGVVSLEVAKAFRKLDRKTNERDDV